MAKQAKEAVVGFSDRDVKKYVADVLERYERIESARGKFMLAARREREGMQATYEGMAAKGVAQKVSKLQIEIIRLTERLKSRIADLEVEERRMLDRLAKGYGDKRQLSLLLDVPKPKTEKTEKAAKAEKAEKAKTNGNVVPLQPGDAPSAA